MLRPRAIRRPLLTVSYRIQNPLAGISRILLLQDVEDFAGKHGLLDVLPLLRKGALVAQDPNSYDEIGGPETLDDSEVDALRDEVLHKWKQSRSLYMTVIMVSSNSLSQAIQEDFCCNVPSSSQKVPGNTSYFSILTPIQCSVGAAVQGWDQTGEVLFLAIF